LAVKFWSIDSCNGQLNVSDGDNIADAQLPCFGCAEALPID
jgi:hypothetical protein